MTYLTFGVQRAICDVSHRRRVVTFRATVQQELQRVIMKLEGKMVGPWVDECRQAWLALAPSFPSKKLSLDLRELTFVDASGTQLLREIYGATKAKMLTNSPLTEHFAEQASKQTTKNGWKGV